MPKVPVKKGKLLCKFDVSTLDYENYIAEEVEMFMTDFDQSKEEALESAEYSYNEAVDEYYNEFLTDFGDYLITKGLKRSKQLCFSIKGEHLTWDNKSGSKVVCLDPDSLELGEREIGFKMLSELIGDVTDFSVEVFNFGNDILVIIYHHDVPTGSYFYIQPMAYSTYKRFFN